MKPLKSKSLSAWGWQGMLAFTATSLASFSTLCSFLFFTETAGIVLFFPSQLGFRHVLSPRSIGILYSMSIFDSVLNISMSSFLMPSLVGVGLYRNAHLV